MKTASKGRLAHKTARRRSKMPAIWLMYRPGRYVCACSGWPLRRARVVVEYLATHGIFAEIRAGKRVLKRTKAVAP